MIPHFRGGMPKDVATTLTEVVTDSLKGDPYYMIRVVETLCESPHITSAERDRLRSLGEKAIGEGVAAAKTEGSLMYRMFQGDEKRLAKWVDTERAKLTSPAWRGELIGADAPSVHFLWSNHPGSPKSLADLKGKVVVIDFWTTWCGPCIASFPELRALQQRYKDSPVVVLGITSPQGYIWDRKDSKKIDLPKPEDELEHLRRWIKDMDVTWPIACGKEDVFNPGYGVNGIPHMTIIGPDGKVKFNRVDFRAGDAEAAIDAVLGEFKLPAPKKGT